MSEYQYYEFHAIDRPLTRAEMATLRACSTRATITPTRFVNFYSYGSFKGDERAWMERYFDAFLFQANWGTRLLALRLPAVQLPFKEARRYCGGGSAVARRHHRHVILDLSSDVEGSDDWVEEDGGGLMGSLVPLRGELARGDLRALYLAWLWRAQAGELEPEAEEPPPPPGLGSLTAPQEALADFLRLDRDLLAAAAVASPPLQPVDVTALRAWVRALPEARKTDLIVRLVTSEGEHLRSETIRRARGATATGPGLATGTPRTVAAILEAAEVLSRSRAPATRPNLRRSPGQKRR